MDPLKVLEKQSGFLRLLVYLSGKKEKTLTEILDETNGRRSRYTMTSTETYTLRSRYSRMRRSTDC